MVHGRSLTRVIIYLPAIISPLIMGYIWYFLLQPGRGYLYHALEQLGAPFTLGNWMKDYPTTMEGASSGQQFRYITIPMLKSTTFYVLVNMIIGSFGVFIQVLMLTGGNPRGTTSVLQYLLYDKSFNLFAFGQGAAIGMQGAPSQPG